MKKLLMDNGFSLEEELFKIGEKPFSANDFIALLKDTYTTNKMKKQFMIKFGSRFTDKQAVISTMEGMARSVLVALSKPELNENTAKIAEELERKVAPILELIETELYNADIDGDYSEMGGYTNAIMGIVKEFILISNDGYLSQTCVEFLDAYNKIQHGLGADNEAFIVNLQAYRNDYKKKLDGFCKG